MWNSCMWKGLRPSLQDHRPSQEDGRLVVSTLTKTITFAVWLWKGVMVILQGGSQTDHFRSNIFWVPSFIPHAPVDTKDKGWWVLSQQQLRTGARNRAHAVFQHSFVFLFVCAVKSFRLSQFFQSSQTFDRESSSSHFLLFINNSDSLVLLSLGICQSLQCFCVNTRTKGTPDWSWCRHYDCSPCWEISSLSCMYHFLLCRPEMVEFVVSQRAGLCVSYNCAPERVPCWPLQFGSCVLESKPWWTGRNKAFWFVDVCARFCQTIVEHEGYRQKRAVGGLSDPKLICSRLSLVP